MDHAANPVVEHRGKRPIMSMLRYAKYAIAARGVDRNAAPLVIACSVISRAVR